MKDSLIDIYKNDRECFNNLVKCLEYCPSQYGFDLQYSCLFEEGKKCIKEECVLCFNRAIRQAIREREGM